MILLFDSQCGFCTQFVRFAQQHLKPNSRIETHDLRSPEGRMLLKKRDVAFISLNTVYFIEDKVYKKSTAILSLMKHMESPYNWCAYLQHLPSKFTDRCYDFVAKNRYKISGLFKK